MATKWAKIIYALEVKKISERCYHPLPQDISNRKREAKMAKQSTLAELQMANRKCGEKCAKAFAQRDSATGDI